MQSYYYLLNSFSSSWPLVPTVGFAEGGQASDDFAPVITSTLTLFPIQMVELAELIDDLIYGGRAGDLDEIRESLAAGAPVDGRDANGTTALMMAAANGHVEAMQVLLSAGADINATNERENTSLHWAVFTGQEEAVKTLLAAGGCDVFVKNEQGLTAAMDAERAGKGELVVLILNSLDDEDAAAAALGIDEEKEAEGAEKPVERLAPQARPEPSP